MSLCHHDNLPDDCGDCEIERQDHVSHHHFENAIDYFPNCVYCNIPLEKREVVSSEPENEVE